MPPVTGSGKRPRDMEDDPFDESDAASSFPEGPEMDFTTPRPSARQHRLGATAQGADRSSSVTSGRRSEPSASSASGRSSPRKQMRQAQTEETGFSRANFALNRHQLPSSLARMLDEMKRIANGTRILPAKAKMELASLDIPDHAFDDANRGTLKESHFPTAQVIIRLLRRAVRCDYELEGECSWNNEVHSPLLSWVCRPDDNEGLVDYRYCTSAGVVMPWKPKYAPSKMVDYCMVIRPAQGSPEVEEICAIKANRPGQSVNHSDWGNLVQDPIVVSIETKRQEGDAVKATLQMATWQASQWRSLRALHAGPWEGELGFLPGILVQGHEWSFVASVPGARHTASIFYDKQSIGSTSNEYGICKILAALEHLRSWAAEEYWPAYTSSVLGLG